MMLHGAIAIASLASPAKAAAQRPIERADAHVHLSAGAEADLDRLLANGVTVVRDAGGDLQQLVRWRAEIAAGTRRGPRLLIAGPTLDGPKPGAVNRLTVTNAADAEAAVDSLARLGVDFIKAHNAVPRDAFFAIIRRARLRGLRVAAHLPRGVPAWVAADSGVGSIEHAAESLIASPIHAGLATDAESALRWWESAAGDSALRRLAHSGVTIVPTLVRYESSIATAPTRESREGRAAVLPRLQRLVGRAHRAGIPILVGSDLAGLPGSLPSWAGPAREVELLVASGLTPQEASAAASPRALLDWFRRAPSAVAFVGVNVVPMTDGDSILADHTVIVRDGRIAVIGPSAAVALPRDALRIDAAGRYLLPGLVDAHVHLEHFDDPAILALFLASGVTSVRNMDGRPHLLEWRRRIASGELVGPTIHSAGPILDGDPPARGDNTIVRTATESRSIVAAQKSAGFDFVKVYTNITPEAYRAVLQAARERGMFVAGHVPRRLSLADALHAGQHSVEHLTDFDELIEADSSALRGRFHWSKLYLAMAADAEKMARAAERVAASRTWVVPTMIQAERAVADSDSVQAWLAAPEAAYLPAEGRQFWKEQASRIVTRMDAADWAAVARGRANRRAMLKALRAADARIALGTDTPNPFVIPGVSVHEELAIFVEAGYSPRQALLVATRRAHELTGAARLAGTIEVGKRADLLLLAGNPLADVANVRRPLGIMAHGSWIPRSRLDAMLAALAAR